ILAFGARLTSAAETKSLNERFDFLSKNGNSNCTPDFLNSIATMPAVARLHGSCCSPMELERSNKPLEGLGEYSARAEIPADPYDTPAGNAEKVMPYYELARKPDEQRAYQYAMDNSEEKGPCCCRCWRWKMYGGLAKYLIRERRFTGEQVTEVWNLSNGCGGG